MAVLGKALFAVAALFIGFVQTESCKACKRVSIKLENLLEENLHDGVVAIGHRLDENGEYRAHKTVEWKKSEMRLHDVMDQVCPVKDIEEHECFGVLEDYEEQIQKWYFESEHQRNLNETLCADICEREPELPDDEDKDYTSNVSSSEQPASQEPAATDKAKDDANNIVNQPKDEL